MSSAQRVQVDLERSSWIEGRSVRHTDWIVRINDAWVPIKSLRNVELTATDPELSFFEDEVDEMRVLPPGCQYRTTYHPRLPVGTRVQRTVSVPLEQPSRHKRQPETIQEAFTRLIAAGTGPKSPRKTTYTNFRVGPRGLVTEEAWQRMQQRGEGIERAPVTRTRTMIVSEAVAPGEMKAFAQRLGKVGRLG